MKVKCKCIKEIDFSYLDCYLFSRYWEDSDISLNGSDFEEVKEDASNLPQSMMYLGDETITSYKGFYGEKCFRMKIDFETGKILNWEQGYKMKIHWKVVDQGVYSYYDKDNNLIDKLEDYVPDFLGVDNDSYGDYVIMSVNEDGQIDNWNPNTVARDIQEMFNSIFDNKNDRY